MPISQLCPLVLLILEQEAWTEEDQAHLPSQVSAKNDYFARKQPTFLVSAQKCLIKLPILYILVQFKG